MWCGHVYTCICVCFSHDKQTVILSHKDNTACIPLRSTCTNIKYLIPSSQQHMSQYINQILDNNHKITVQPLNSLVCDMHVQYMLLSVSITTPPERWNCRNLFNLLNFLQCKQLIISQTSSNSWLHTFYRSIVTYQVSGILVALLLVSCSTVCKLFLWFPELQSHNYLGFFA